MSTRRDRRCTRWCELILFKVDAFGITDELGITRDIFGV